MKCSCTFLTLLCLLIFDLQATASDARLFQRTAQDPSTAALRGGTDVSGRVYWDKNGDRQFNDDDSAFRGVMIQLAPGGFYTYTDQDGFYTIQTDTTGLYQLDVEVPAILECNTQVPFIIESPAELPFEFTATNNGQLERDFIFNAPVDFCRTVSGKVFSDANENGTEDAGEAGVPGIRVVTSDDRVVFTNFQGGYSFNLLNSSSENFVLDLPGSGGSTNCYSSQASSYAQTYPADGEGYTVEAGSGAVSALDFGVFETISASYNTAIITFNVNAGDVPGEVFHAWLDFKAFGTITQPCTLRIEHSPLVTLNNAAIPPANTSDTSVEWIFAAGTAPSFFCMHMNWTISEDAVPGDTLHWEATYECPPGVDACPENNSAIRDIVLVEGDFRQAAGDLEMYSMRAAGIMPEIIEKDDELSYLISFQNPLEHTAYDVLVIDTLPEEIDLNSISLPFSSFPDYTFTISPEGVLIWQLNGVDLRNAGEDFLNSYGFVQFNATLKPDLPESTVIRNKATAYFNGIARRTSNEVVHRFGSAVPVNNVLNNAVGISMYPNPMSRQMVLDIAGDPSASYQVQISDLMGRSLRQYHPITSRLLIERGTLPPGIYLLTIRATNDAQVSGSFRFVVQ